MSTVETVISKAPVKYPFVNYVSNPEAELLKTYLLGDVAWSQPVKAKNSIPAKLLVLPWLSKTGFTDSNVRFLFHYNTFFISPDRDDFRTRALALRGNLYSFIAQVNPELCLGPEMIIDKYKKELGEEPLFGEIRSKDMERILAPSILARVAAQWATNETLLRMGPSKGLDPFKFTHSSYIDGLYKRTPRSSGFLSTQFACGYDFTSKVIDNLKIAGIDTPNALVALVKTPPPEIGYFMQAASYSDRVLRNVS